MHAAPDAPDAFETPGDVLAWSGAVVRIQVISAEPIVRTGIETVLNNHSSVLECVTPASGAPAASTAVPGPDDPAPACAADVVLYDVIGLHIDGSRDLEDAVKGHPGRVIALSRALQPGLTARALALGAVASVPLGATDDQLVAAIKATMEGHLQDGSRRRPGQPA
jgi:DNA-binding NarL/FixJ family response regulator